MYFGVHSLYLILAVVVDTFVYILCTVGKIGSRFI